MRPLSALVTVSLSLSLIAAASAQQPQNSPPPAQPGVIGQQPDPQQQGGAAPVAPHIIVQGIPGVQQCPAPDWIKPGMRLAFLQASASIASNASDAQLVEDPNGDIVDEHGKHSRETEFVSGSAGGAGYAIIDVVAVEPPPNGVIVMQSSNYLLVNGTQGPASLTGSVGYWCHPSGCDYFMHPRMLAQLQPIDQNGFSIMRHSYTANNQRFNAVRITNNAGGRTTYVYDLTSGVLLSQNASSLTQGGQVYRDGYIVPTSGQTMAITRFISARNLNLPWQGGQMPPWVRTMKNARYAGATITRAPANLGTADYRVGITLNIETTFVGSTFAVYKITNQPAAPSDIPGANDPSTTVAVCGPGSLGGLWMDPNMLRQLRTGQAIDRDPTIGSQTVVEFAGQGQNGRAVVALTTASPAQKITAVYDATDGKLLTLTRTDAPGEAGFYNITELQLAGME